VPQVEVATRKRFEMKGNDGAPSLCRSHEETGIYPAAKNNYFSMLKKASCDVCMCVRVYVAIRKTACAGPVERGRKSSPPVSSPLKNTTRRIFLPIHLLLLP